MFLKLTSHDLWGHRGHPKIRHLPTFQDSVPLWIKASLVWYLVCLSMFKCLVLLFFQILEMQHCLSQLQHFYLVHLKPSSTRLEYLELIKEQTSCEEIEENEDFHFVTQSKSPTFLCPANEVEFWLSENQPRKITNLLESVVDETGKLIHFDGSTKNHSKATSRTFDLRETIYHKYLRNYFWDFLDTLYFY